MQGSIQLYIRVTHTISDPDQQLIDDMYIEIGNLSSCSPRMPVEQFIGNGGRVQAGLQFRLQCDPGWYGPYCDVECHDLDAHYQCDCNGDWECMEGYQNLETNCTECLAADGCSKCTKNDDYTMHLCSYTSILLIL